MLTRICWAYLGRIITQHSDYIGARTHDGFVDVPFALAAFYYDVRVLWIGVQPDICWKTLLFDVQIVTYLLMAAMKGAYF